jgi:hypothetical protein
MDPAVIGILGTTDANRLSLEEVDLKGGKRKYTKIV